MGPGSNPSENILESLRVRQCRHLKVLGVCHWRTFELIYRLSSLTRLPFPLLLYRFDGIQDPCCVLETCYIQIYVLQKLDSLKKLHVSSEKAAKVGLETRKALSCTWRDDITDILSTCRCIRSPYQGLLGAYSKHASRVRRHDGFRAIDCHIMQDITEGPSGQVAGLKERVRKLQR